ncbi:hypothetical protein OSB04_010002 [Centaurea solstitialis]|uniref:Reverse transcriptase domain-containing protein n=1 Tax=Centaurea solstitialis TaxID=347529 RepID=A0AA38T6P2_9ASTR|nr:hypothetical protein OSB04_010002 [Centaurea solstitialis]
MSGGDVRNVSPGDIQMVQNLIEQCLPYYMTQKQVIDILYQQEKVEPSFTELVWQKLEEQNQEFFKGYHLRLMVKEQIMEFNKLLDRQAALMQQLGPTGVGFQPKSNGSHMPAIHQNSTCYAPAENSGIALKTENMPHPSAANFSRGFNACGLPIPSGDMSAHSRRIDVPPNMLLAQNSNVGLTRGTNGVSVKTEANYLGNSRFIYGAADGNVMETRPTIGDPSVSSFSCLESDPHQLNGTLLNDSSLFGLLGPMPQNFGLSDSTADFTNSSDMLESFSRSAFLPSDRDSFLDSHSSTVEHQGETTIVGHKSLFKNLPISLVEHWYLRAEFIKLNKAIKVISSVIGEEQSAYIKGRSILDGPLMLNELISWAKRCKKSLFFLKIDIEKAFDSLSWNFLDSILDQMNFGLKWRKWLCYDLYSRQWIPVRGIPMSRGVRQGDPMAPLLFIIAMEGVNLPNNGPGISHFFFADDALFVGKWSFSNLSNLLRLLRCFHLASGLKVNLSKTMLYATGVKPESLSWAASKFQCTVGDFPFKYLGLLVGSSMSRCAAWQPLIGKFHSKLSSWRAIALSSAGRMVLCKSVLGSIGTYLLSLSLYKVPEAVLAKLERRSSEFQEDTLGAWNNIMAKRERGGLGIGSLKALNLALLSKWWWRLKAENHLSLWCRSILSINKSLQAVNIDIRSLLIRNSTIGHPGSHSAWTWSLNPSGDFSVCSLRNLIDDTILINTIGLQTRWLISVPSKVNIMVRRLMLNRLASKSNLVKRNIPVSNSYCIFCGFGLESEDHLFLSCPLASLLWKEFMKWWNLNLTAPSSISDMMDWGTRNGFKGKQLQAFNTVLLTFCWIIWDYRNNKIFNKQSVKNHFFNFLHGSPANFLPRRRIV